MHHPLGAPATAGNTPKHSNKMCPLQRLHLLHRLQAGQLCSVPAGTQLCFLEPQAKSPHSSHHLSLFSSEPALEGVGLSETHLRHRPPWPLASPGACPLHTLILPTLPPLYPTPLPSGLSPQSQPRPQCFSVTSRAFPNSCPCLADSDSTMHPLPTLCPLCYSAEGFIQGGLGGDAVSRP